MANMTIKNLLIVYGKNKIKQARVTHYFMDLRKIIKLSNYYNHKLTQNRHT